MKWLNHRGQDLANRKCYGSGKMAALLLTGLLVGCQSDIPASPRLDESSLGTLEFRANGEDFVRQGFVAKDGWAVQFQHVYVTLADLTAAATSSAVGEIAAADDVTPVEATKAVGAAKAAGLAKLVNASLTVEGIQTVDLVPAPGAAETALVKSLDAEATHYDALAWTMVPAIAGPAQGQTLQLVGQATRDDRTVDFVIGWDRSHRYVCGDFIGEQRKGIVKPGERGGVEATFHFDHVFGNAEADDSDPVNLKAVGFEPFAALAQEGRVVLERADLEAKLAPEDFETLQLAFTGLGHVGEGHCDAELVEDLE